MLTRELCCICYENLKKPIAITKCCNHFFCFTCITKSFYHQQKMICPYCRNNFTNNNFVVLKDDESKETVLQAKTKRNELLKLITKKNKKKESIIVLYEDKKRLSCRWWNSDMRIIPSECHNSIIDQLFTFNSTIENNNKINFHFIEIYIKNNFLFKNLHKTLFYFK